MDGRDYLTSVLSDDHVPQELRAYYESFRELRDQRLWYQLTLQVESFLRHPASQERPRHIDLYEHFIRTFARHINHLVLASMGVIVSRQYEHAADALAFLQRLATETDQPETQDAHVLLSMEAAHFQLLLGDLSGTRAAMDRCAKLLDSFDAVEPVVHASFYRVCGNYHKAKAEYADYYRNYFLFLACIHVDAEMSKAEQVQCAHDLSISALLGDTIYNFGELLLHPILASLQGSEYAWLADLLFAFNAGDMPGFLALLSEDVIHDINQGGREIGFGSDADVMYAYAPAPDADPGEARSAAETVLNRMVKLLKQPCTPPVVAERVLEIDNDLRPEGRSGTMVRSVAS